MPGNQRPTAQYREVAEAVIGKLRRAGHAIASRISKEDDQGNAIETTYSLEGK